jgi:hypothetical protein
MRKRRRSARRRPCQASFRKTNRAERGAAVRNPVRYTGCVRLFPADVTEWIPDPDASAALGLRSGMTRQEMGRRNDARWRRPRGWAWTPACRCSSAAASMTKAVLRHAGAEAVPPRRRPASFRKTNRAERGASVRNPVRHTGCVRLFPADVTEWIPDPDASAALGVRSGMTRRERGALPTIDDRCRRASVAKPMAKQPADRGSADQ